MQKMHTTISFITGNLPSQQQDMIGMKLGHTAEAIGAGASIGSGIGVYLSEYHEVFFILGILAGIATGLAGVWIQWHFNKRRDTREQSEKNLEAERHELEMSVLKAKLKDLKS